MRAKNASFQRKRYMDKFNVESVHQDSLIVEMAMTASFTWGRAIWHCRYSFIEHTLGCWSTDTLCKAVVQISNIIL